MPGEAAATPSSLPVLETAGVSAPPSSPPPSTAEEKSASSASTTPRAPPVTFLSLFRFADRVDLALLALALLCAAGSGVVIPLTSLVLGNLLNSTSEGTAFASQVDTSSWHMTLLSVGAFLFLGGGVALSFVASQRQVHRLRLAYFKSLLAQEVSYSDTHSMAQAATRLTEQTVNVQSGIGEKLFLIVSGACQFFGSLALAFSVSASAWRLALTLIAALPAVVGAVGFLFTFLQQLSGESDDSYARAGEIAAESLTMARTVAALGAEEHEAGRYEKHLAAAEKVGRSRGLVSGVGQGIFYFTMSALYAIGLYAGARFIALNRQEHPECVFDPTAYVCFNGGTTIQVLFAIVGGAFAMGLVAPNLSFVAAAQAAAAEMFAVIDRTPEVDSFTEEGLAPATCSWTFEFKGVCFSYPSRPQEPILDDFNLTLKPGCSTALVGPSGSGKSTLIALLQRWYKPTAGVILLDGVDITLYNVRWLRAHMGLVQQEPLLLPGTVAENISAGWAEAVGRQQQGKQGGGAAPPSALSTASMQEAAAAAEAHAFISALPEGYDTRVTSSQLSGGQKQRLCIARALARNCPVLLMDEATSALDSASEARVFQAVNARLSSPSAQVSQGAPTQPQLTGLVIAHRLSSLASCGRIVVMERGRLVEEGTHEELLSKGSASGLYARLWELQQHEPAPSPLPSSGIEGFVPATSAPPPSTSKATAAEGKPFPPTLSEQQQQQQLSFKEKDVTVVVDGEGGGCGPGDTYFSWASVPTVPWGLAWALQKPEAGWLLLALALASANGVVLPAFALLLSRFVEIFYKSDSNEMISQALIYLGIFMGLAVACFFLNMVQGYAFAAAGEPFVRRVRASAFASMVSQSIGFLEGPLNDPGRLGSRLGADAQKMKLALGPRLGEKVSALATLVAGIALAFHTSWQLTLVVLCLGPLVILSADAENQVTFGSTEEIKAGYAEAGGIASDSVPALRMLHAYGLQQLMLDKFEVALTAPYLKGMRRALGLAVGFGSSQFMQSIIVAIVFKAGLTLMQSPNSGVSPASIYLVFFAFQFSCFGLVNLVSLGSDMAGIKDALKSFFSIILRRSDIDGTEGGATGEKGKGGKISTELHLRGNLEFRNVTFSYPTRPGAQVLKGMSFTLAPGSTTAIVGPSGGGKSTIVQLLLRFYKASGGSILLDGQDIEALPVRALRDAMAWVPQEAPLFSDSIVYNIAMGRSGGKAKKPEAEQGMAREAPPEAPMPENFAVPPDVQRAAEEANAFSFIAGFKHGFATHVGDAGRSLSGGQKQRVALSRALVRPHASFLLLDEATSALDSESESVVQASIDALLAAQKSEGKALRTTVMIAHRLSSVRSADQILVVDGGCIVEQGSWAQLVQREDGLFRKLVLAQGLSVAPSPTDSSGGGGSQEGFTK